MRPLELILLAILAVALLGRFWRRDDRPRWMRVLPGVLVALLVLHVALEHYRWQMVPAYLLVGILAVRALGSRAPQPPAGWGRRIGRGLAVLAGLATVGLSWFLGAGFPVFTAPAPSGPHGVGTARLYFIDRNRPDPFAPPPGHPREVPAAVWYPADVPEGAPRDPFWPPDNDPHQAVGLPAFLFSHVPLVQAHSTAGAPLARADRQYPVILFSHGYNSSPWQNVPQMEELASHGFIVISLGHPYDATALTLSDGRVVRDNSWTRPPAMRPGDQAAVNARTQKLAAMRDPEAIKAEWRDIQALMVRTNFYIVRSVDVWAADTRFVVDRLQGLNTGDTTGASGATALLAGRMDLDRLGIFGMSFGGSTAGTFCATDRRCKAGVNFDGWQFGDMAANPLAVPFLYMTGLSNLFPVYDGSTADLYEVHVNHAAHGNFDDLSLVAPVFTWISRPRLEMLGTIKADQMERIMSTYSLAFFQQYLQGKPQPVLSAPRSAEMPNVEVTARLARPAAH